MKASATALIVLLFAFSASAATVTAKPIQLAGVTADSIAAVMPAPAAYTGYNESGVRVSYVKPFYTARVKTDFGNFSDSLITDGFSFGYVHLPIRQFGYTADAALLMMKNEGQENMVRLGANAAYAVSPFINLKAGLNLSNFIDKDMRENVKAGVGLQASVGFNITPNVGADIGYTRMHQKFTMNEEFGSFRANYFEDGIELGLNSTF